MTFQWVSSGVEGIRPMWLDFDQCDDSERGLPAGYSDTHWDWRADRSGYVKTIGGHVHDHGISIAWQNRSRSRHVFASVAGYAAGSEFDPAGPGSGSDASHPRSARVVTSDPLGLANFEGHLSDMTVGRPSSDNGRVAKGNSMRLHTQYNRPTPTPADEGDMGIMILSFDEDLCITDLFCF
jgi:hypothetical protein